MQRLALALVMAASLCASAQGGFIVYFDDSVALQAHQGNQVVHAFLRAENNDEPVFNGVFLGAIVSGPAGVEFKSTDAIRFTDSGYVWDRFPSEPGTTSYSSPQIATNTIRFLDKEDGSAVGVKLEAGEFVKFASFLIDTTNVSSGQITIGPAESERNYLVIGGGADSASFAFQSATLNIVATPEPGTLGCIALCAAVSVGVRKRLRRRSQPSAKVA